VQDLDALGAEQPVEVELVDAELAADLAGAVVPDAGGAAAEARVGDVELVPEAPGVALVELRALVAHVALAQVGLDERRDGGALDEGGEDEGRLAQVRHDARDIGLGAGGLQEEAVGDVHRCTVLRGDPDAHRGGDDEGPAGVLAELHELAFRVIDSRETSSGGDG